MLKKRIAYENLEGEVVTEEFLFHLSKADIIELELSAGDGGLNKRLKRIVESEDNRQIYEEFKKIVLSAYGKRSEDGKNFIKSASIRAEFEGTEAFSNLVMELLENEDAASDFVNAITPRDLSAAGISTSVPVEPEPSPENQTQVRVLTQAEVIEMDSDELKSGLATGRYKIG